MKLDVTNSAHIQVSGLDAMSSKTIDNQGWETTNSANSVNLEQEMLKAGDVGRDYSLAMNITRSFQRMYLSSLK